MAMTDDRRDGRLVLGGSRDPAVTSTGRVQFSVLRGGVKVVREGEPVAIGGPQQQRLLAALLAAQGAAVSADRLAETIWPDGAAPEGARRSVMTYVSRLRAAVGGDYVVTGANGYQLVLADASYDAAEFEDRLAAARVSRRSRRTTMRCRCGRVERSVTTGPSGGWHRWRRGWRSCASSPTRNAAGG
jgi:Transcriptional regulatory protein, C terminal